MKKMKREIRSAAVPQPMLLPVNVSQIGLRHEA
jgi:hypothetical protein